MKISQHTNKRRTLILTIVIFFSLFGIAIAQTSTSSPYSRYGIGDVGGKGFSQGFAMGGTHIAMQNDSTQLFFINSGNPASYSSIGLTTIELGLNYTHLQLQNNTQKKTTNSASFGYMALAFPIKKWWVSSIGLLPYSSVGYKISDAHEVPLIGKFDLTYEGAGGINQTYFGNGIKPLYGVPGAFLKSKKYTRLKQENNLAKINRILKRKQSWQNLSLGVNASYLFGTIENIRRSVFPGVGLTFNTRADATTRLSGIYLDYGAQYVIKIDTINGRGLKDRVKLIIGATYSPQTNINAHIDSLATSYFSDGKGFEYVKDTTSKIKDAKGTMTLPSSIGFGIGFKKGDKWLVSADFTMQNWSSYKILNKTQGLNNSASISVGAQYMPNSNSVGLNNYYKRIQYRIGSRYSQTAIELKNTPLTEYAASVGLGFPVGRNYILQNFSMVNIGAEFGQRGTVTNGLIRETFFRALIGFTINDRWFIKPKID
ncbi:MAG: hypothetical protein ABI315_10885 [Bacteroidia bacterium]